MTEKTEQSNQEENEKEKTKADALKLLDEIIGVVRNSDSFSVMVSLDTGDVTMGGFFVANTNPTLLLGNVEKLRLRLLLDTMEKL